MQRSRILKSLGTHLKPNFFAKALIKQMVNRTKNPVLKIKLQRLYKQKKKGNHLPDVITISLPSLRSLLQKQIRHHKNLLRLRLKLLPDLHWRRRKLVRMKLDPMYLQRCRTFRLAENIIHVPDIAPTRSNCPRVLRSHAARVQARPRWRVRELFCHGIGFESAGAGDEPIRDNGWGGFGSSVESHFVCV